MYRTKAMALLAPAKTPPAVVSRLNDAMLKVQLEKLGAVIVGDSPSKFPAYLKRDHDRWENVIKAANIKPEANCGHLASSHFSIWTITCHTTYSKPIQSKTCGFLQNEGCLGPSLIFLTAEPK